MSKESVKVTVEYVGQEPFTDNVPGEMVLKAIKVQAMKKFELSPGDADKYVLKFNGAVIEDNKHIGDFDSDEVIFELSLKEEVNKG